VEAGVSYEDRVARRKEEIESAEGCEEAASFQGHHVVDGLV